MQLLNSIDLPGLWTQYILSPAFCCDLCPLSVMISVIYLLSSLSSVCYNLYVFWYIVYIGQIFWFVSLLLWYLSCLLCKIRFSPKITVDISNRFSFGVIMLSQWLCFSTWCHPFLVCCDPLFDETRTVICLIWSLAFVWSHLLPLFDLVFCLCWILIWSFVSVWPDLLSLFNFNFCLCLIWFF